VSAFTPAGTGHSLRVTSHLARLLGKAPSVVPFNLPFEGCSESCNYYTFPTAQMNAVNQYGAVVMLNWASMSSPLSVSEPAFSLAAVARGDYDSYIRAFAVAARQWGHPFLLRFDWEMNGNWFPWAEGANGNTPGSYVAAWRHVHDIFASVGATNANWVWCPNVDWQHQFIDLHELYPGNSYVDWTCMDGYNFGSLGGSTPSEGWMTFNQIFSSTYSEIASIAPSKPMIIGETASTAHGGDKAAWITDMFNQIATGYPLLRGLIWFDAAQGNDDWYLETDHPALNAFTAGITNPSYTTNSFAMAATLSLG